MFELTNDGGAVSIGRLLFPGSDDKAAIGAFRLAKRDVNVDTEIGHCSYRQVSRDAPHENFVDGAGNAEFTTSGMTITAGVRKLKDFRKGRNAGASAHMRAVQSGRGIG